MSEEKAAEVKVEERSKTDVELIMEVMIRAVGQTHILPYISTALRVKDPGNPLVKNYTEAQRERVANMVELWHEKEIALRLDEALQTQKKRIEENARKISELAAKLMDVKHD